MTEQQTAIWLRPERATHGPTPEHSRAEIAAAAIELADHDGLAGLTMRSLARAIGTSPASLYRYVTTREELVELIVDEVNGEFDLRPATSGDWLEHLVDLAHQARDIYRRHPWMIEALDAAPALGPHGCDYLEHTLATLAQTPTSGRTRLEAAGIFSGVVRMLCKADQERRRQEHRSGGSTRRGAYATAVATAGGHPAIAAALADLRRPHTAEGGGSEGAGTGESSDAQFDRIVRRTLLGLVDERESRPTPGSS